MIRLITALIILCLIISCSSNKNIGQEMKWISLFDGKTFNGWKMGENPGTFSIEDGSIKVAGPRSHLYYDGAVMNHDFKNFEFKAQVMTKPGSNSGIYIHTPFQEKGLPDKGLELQDNNSHTDWKRSGGLYDIKDTREVYVKDDVWYTEYIRVEGKHVIVKINDQVVTDWTQPEDFVPAKNHLNRIIASGTFALQGHDPKSIVYYKDIMVRALK
ncbi:MAG: 3-keto-disaccharide hydrolase [Chitinophagaceae bacterium]